MVATEWYWWSRTERRARSLPSRSLTRRVSRIRPRKSSRTSRPSCKRWSIRTSSHSNESMRTSSSLWSRWSWSWAGSSRILWRWGMKKGSRSPSVTYKPVKSWSLCLKVWPTYTPKISSIATWSHKIFYSRILTQRSRSWTSAWVLSKIMENDRKRSQGRRYTWHLSKLQRKTIRRRLICGPVAL